MRLTIYIPPLPEGKDPEELLTEALRSKRKPGIAPKKGAKRIRIETRNHKGLKEQAEKAGRSLEETAAGLIWEMAHPHHTDPKTDREALQTPLVREIVRNAKEGKIGMEEGGTGIGKSRILAWAGMELTEKGGVVIAAAPTVSNIVHLANEWEKAGGKPSEATILLGRRQFINTRRLQEDMALLKQEDTPGWEDAKHWLEMGCPTTSESGKTLEKFLPGIQALAEDMRAAAPEFPVDAYRLEEAEDELSPEETAYQSMRDGAFDQSHRIVFTTHAMLLLAGCQIRNTKGLLPTEKAKSWLIDEAHQLENNLMLIVSNGVPLLSLKRALGKTEVWKKYRAGATAQRALKECERCAIELAENVERTATVFPSDMREGNKECWRNLRNPLKKLTKELDRLAKKKGREPETREVAQWAIALRRAASEKEVVTLSVSPVRRYGTITVGPLRSERYFERLWKSAQSAALLSGTLSVDTKSGAPDYGYMAEKLGVAQTGRLKTLDPIHPKWNYESPTVYHPTTLIEALTYPNVEEEGEEAMEKWWDATASAVIKIHKKAAGGVLVLCNSFKDTEALGKRIKSKKGREVITHKKGESIPQQKEEFLKTHRNGGKALWLATGPAWTGLDLSEESQAPEKDFLLTTLVVLRTPYGLNRSSTHIHRTRGKGGFAIEMMEAIIHLRQGFGRLIRREGLKKREIYFLDSRMFGRHRQGFSRIEGLLSHYAKRKPLEDALKLQKK